MSIEKVGKNSKKDKFVVERQTVLDQLYIILGITETNKVFYLEELEKNRDKQNQIIELLPNIKKYFSCSVWSYFSKPRYTGECYASLVKSLIKNMDRKITLIIEKREHGKNIHSIKIE